MLMSCSLQLWHVGSENRAAYLAARWLVLEGGSTHVKQSRQRLVRRYSYCLGRLHVRVLVRVCVCVRAHAEYNAMQNCHDDRHVHEKRVDERGRSGATHENKMLHA